MDMMINPSATPHPSLMSSHHFNSTLPPPSISIHDHRSPHQPTEITIPSMDHTLLHPAVQVSRDYNEYFELGYHAVTPGSNSSSHKASGLYDGQPHYGRKPLSTQISDGRAKLSSPSSDCMYSDSSAMDCGNVSILSHNATSPSLIKAEPELSPSSLVTTTAIPSILSPNLCSITPMGDPSFVSPRSLEEFDITNPADIMSLDQPIRLTTPTTRTNRRSSSCSNPDLRSSLDFTSLFGLPGINSFLDEEENQHEKIQEQNNEHVEKILGLSLNYGSPDTSKDSTGMNHLSPSSSSDQKVPSTSSPGCSPGSLPSPPLLAELQPLHSTKSDSMTTNSRRFTDIFSVKPNEYTDTSSSSPSLAGAFQPYNASQASRDYCNPPITATTAGYPSSIPKSYYHTDSYGYYPVDMYNYPITSVPATHQHPPNSLRNHNNRHINITVSL